MKTRVLLFCLLAIPSLLSASPGMDRPSAIVYAEKASAAEKLAAREVRRYWYVRTGQVLPLVEAAKTLPEKSGLIIVARKDQAPIEAVAEQAALQPAISALAPQQYLLKTVLLPSGQADVLVGGDDAGTLYAAYRFAERLDVRFYLHGDTFPDAQENLRLPLLNEAGQPLFAIRGIQPFHDFPEGPDWWNLDDYKAIISQLAKLRMNFIGLHTYPENRPNAEPTVWIGLSEDIGEQGKVKASYPSSYQNTLRGNWGYQKKKTSDFSYGTGELFEADGFGCDVMLGCCPHPTNAVACNELFNQTATLLRAAFRHAHQLGIKTCVGTETPLVVPKQVAERLATLRKDPQLSATIQALYEGIFNRAAAAYDLDYYWFWTPEDWTWKDVKPEQVAATSNDLAMAIAAANRVHPPFKLATCGWVLGPQTDRALFDKILPKDIAVSCINREVGKTPVDPAFAKVEGRSKWAIPWMEDDPALTSPQLWAGRMRRDAADARRYGCDGLLGIHWRTRVLGPAVSALAQAGWEQGEWSKSASKPVDMPRTVGPVGGQSASFSKPIEDTEDDPLYQTVRYNMSAYHLPFSNGLCAVTLKFCEPHYSNAAQRVFDVKLQGKTVLENLDVLAKVGRNRALDFTFEDVVVTNERVSIEFLPRVEYPCIAAISIRNRSSSLNINCGGSAYKDFVADYPAAPAPKQVFPSTSDFYQDWAAHEFGPEVAPAAAAIFAKIDGNLPRPSDWIEGPGGIRPDKRPWDKVSPEYAYVDEFASLRPKVKGAGHQERFDYWLHTFQYMRAMAQLNCAWAQYDKVFDKLKAAKTNAATAGQPDLQLASSPAKAGTNSVSPLDAAKTAAFMLRLKVVQLAGAVYEHLLPTLSNPGELGTLANWEQHLLPDVLHKPGKELAQLFGKELPPEAHLPQKYKGPARVIVPTVRTSFTPGEELKLILRLLAEQPPKSATLHWRAMGRGKFAEVSAARVLRGVYHFHLPREATTKEDLEYYVKVVPAKGKTIYFPATAPEINQTLVAQ